MNDRIEYKLGELVNSISETYKFNNEEVIFLNTSDIYWGKIINHQKFHPKDLPGQAKKKIKKNDLLFSEIRPANGRFALVNIDPENYVVSTKLIVIRCSDKILPKFLYYFLTSDEQLSFLQMIAESRSGTFPQIIFNNISDLNILLPQVSEQFAISEFLSSLDDKIDLLHRQNKTLEQLAETLFRQWFVNETVESWKIGKLSDVLELVYGKTLKEETRSGKGFPVVGSSGIVGYHSDFLVEKPGIVIGRKGTLGKVNYMFENFFPIDTTYYVKSKINSIGLFYEYFLLKSLNLVEMNSDSAVPGLNRDIAHSMEINIAPLEKIREFNSQCLTLFEKENINTNQIQTLTKLRDILLPKLMSGEINVKVN